LPPFSAVTHGIGRANPSTLGGNSSGVIIEVGSQILRFFGVFFLGALIAAGFYLYLGARDATSSLDAVATIASTLREENITGSNLDRETARQMISAMEDLVAAPDTISDHVSDLKTFATTAASWADAAATPSTELHVAVALRRAAGELRGYALAPSQIRLSRSRQLLAAARSSLDNESTGMNGGQGPGLAVGALKDRIDNLQQSHQERIQEIDEELKN